MKRYISTATLLLVTGTTSVVARSYGGEFIFANEPMEASRALDSGRYEISIDDDENNGAFYTAPRAGGGLSSFEDDFNDAFTVPKNVYLELSNDVKENDDNSTMLLDNVEFHADR